MAKKILIVDDSRTIRQQVTFTLQKSGFDVVEAEDGVQGIEKLQGNPDIALVISDVNMPNMNGLEMLGKIKADANLSKYPIVMLTTEGSADLIQQARTLGAKGWLVKPFQPAQLIAAVEKITAA